MEKDKQYDDLIWQRETIAYDLGGMYAELKPITKSMDGHKSLQEEIHEGLKKINSLNESIKEPFKIAVVGAQGTGKSTIINVLLGEPIMIVDFDETEGGIVKLVFTEDAELEKKACIKYFTDKEGVYKEEFIARDEFKSLIDLSHDGKLKTDPVYRDSIAFFEIYSQNEMLKNIQFVNTPGMNTITADFLTKVRHLFIEADMIIWMAKRVQILDFFNANLIPQIYKDNKNIICVLGFADDIYQMDRVNGLQDVLADFFDNVEKKMLLRKESAGQERICFFIYNGLAAESALGMKPDPAEIIKKLDDPSPAEENDLKMLWNYIEHGFPFSDEGTAVVDKFSLWNEYKKGMNTEKVTGIYERDDFINWLYKNDFIKNEGGGCVLTETGKAITLESSMLPYIENFAQEHIFGSTLATKISRVKEGFNNLYGDRNILWEIKKIRADYEKIIEENDKEAAATRKDMDVLKAAFRSRYREWYLTRMQRYSNQMSSSLVKRIIEEINKKIGKTDLGKELLKQVTPKMFRSDDEGPVTKEVSRIIEIEFENIIEEKTESITKEAVEEAKNIVTELTIGASTGEKIKDKKINIGDEKPGGPKIIFKSDMSKLNKFMKMVMVEIGKKITVLIKKIAAADMRKKGMTKFKKYFIKLFREILKKLGTNLAKKLTAKLPTRAVPIIGWILLAKDIIDTGLMVNEMLDQLKEQLEKAIRDNQDEFFDNFKEILEPAYNEVQAAIFEELEEAMNPGGSTAEDPSTGISICDKVIHIFEVYKLKVGKSYGE